MYEEFYGFKEKPFNLLPDPEYIYMSRGHENVYTHLEYAVSENKGFVVVTGEIGSGKTTLINYLLRKIRNDIHVGIINNPDVPPQQFIKMICREFELETSGKDKAGMLETFSDFLLDEFSAKRRVVLILDEAQNLPKRTIEEIRLLSNLEAEKHHLIQIILVGQPELKAKLKSRGMEQFVQRVTVYCHLEGLGEDDVAQYIMHRLKVAGAADPNIFDQKAVKAITEYSGGIPRIINTMCDTALVYGYADELKVINEEMIKGIIASRNEGGIYSGESRDEEDAGVRPLGQPGDDFEYFHKRLDLIERRIGLLESGFANLDQRTTMLAKIKEEKDRVFIEMFKMLKAGLDSRIRLHIKFIELKQLLQRTRNENAPKMEQKSSLFSRFKEKKVRKITDLKHHT